METENKKNINKLDVKNIPKLRTIRVWVTDSDWENIRESLKLNQKISIKEWFRIELLQISQNWNEAKNKFG